MNGHAQTNEVFKGCEVLKPNKVDRTPIANGPTASVRKLSKPPLTKPFHVAVDRHLKSGYETYEVAEEAAIGIKRRYPKLHVTVFDAKEQRHTLIEQPRAVSASNKTDLPNKQPGTPSSGTRPLSPEASIDR